MNIKNLFDVFSRRKNTQENLSNTLTQEFKNRVIMLLSRLLQTTQHGDLRNQFFQEMHQKLSFLLGKWHISNDPRYLSPDEDTLAFLLGCDDAYFLDFIESIFQAESYRRIDQDENKLVEDLNELFLLDDIKYAITPFVREPGKAIFYGVERDTKALASYPRVILREDEFSQSSLIEPTINLLSDQGFTSANSEFIEALEDYRKGDLGDCLTKCGSAFESTMKILCDRNGWHYDQADTASKLLRILITHTNLEPFFEQPLIIVATIRNRMSKAHGSGMLDRKVTRPVARFAINTTASAILLLVEHTIEEAS